jgi:hypothetical protein
MVEVEAWPGGTWPQTSEVSFIGLSMEGRDLVSRQARLNYAYFINAGTWFLAFVLAWPPIRYYWRKHKERRDGSGRRSPLGAGAEEDHRGDSEEQQ